MKNFIIDISYSWGDEEEPVEFSAENEYRAFMHMIDIASTEVKVSMEMDEECYYELREV